VQLRLPEPGSFEALVRPVRVDVASLVRLSRHWATEPYWSAGVYRFDDPDPDRLGAFGTCYTADSIEVAFAESAIHESGRFTGGTYEVPSMELTERGRLVFGVIVFFLQIDTPVPKNFKHDNHLRNHRFGALNQHIRVPLHVEPEGPAEVDVGEVRRPDPAQPVFLDSDAFAFKPRYDAVHALGVPGQHDVGQQRMRARDGRHLWWTPATLRCNLSGREWRVAAGAPTHPD
jgi:hypothetical protein